MNLLIVAPTFFPDQDVGIFRMTTLADFLLGKGEHVTVIRNARNRIFSEKIPYQNLGKVTEIQVADPEKFYQSCNIYKDAILAHCRDNPVDVILYTCAPYYAMKIAYEIKKQNQIPYIVDIRDFWLKNNEESILTCILQNMIYPLKYYLQKRCFKGASWIVVVSENMKERYRSFYGTYIDKFQIIYNGYDDQRVSQPVWRDQGLKEKVDGFDGIRIGICGTLCQYSVIYTKLLLETITHINTSHKKVKLFHMGKEDSRLTGILKANHYGREIYEYLGYLPSELCLLTLQKMDMNIIINIRNQGLGTKVFDYIQADRPVIYVGKKHTELADFINRNICTTRKELEEAIRNPETNDFQGVQYTRSLQNKRYYSLIKSIRESKNVT